LIRSPFAITSVLDEATEVVGLTVAPWAAVLILTALPYRFLQALFIDHLFEVGRAASQYGNLLGGTANLIVVSIVIALLGRAIYARACRLAHARGTTPGRETWRIAPAALASYVLTASTALVAGYLGLFTCIGFIVAVLFAGLAVGTMELNERPGVLQPFRHIFKYSKPLELFGVAFVLFCGVFVALANLALASALAVWAAGSIGGFDAPHWQVLFSANNRRYLLMLFAGALVAVEPFWVAAHVVFVRKAGAEERGDDLRAWFEELRRAT
jgi:hypothetical protein